jgi:glycosyltransferase involved in cell wall biosynthesis
VYHVPQNGLHAPVDCGPTRLVVTIHDLIPWVVPEFVRYSYIHRFLREAPAAVESASAVIAVSGQTARDLTRILGVESSKIRVVHPAPEDVFRPVPLDLARPLAAGKYGLDGPYAIYVGGLNPRKNIRDLIYAFDKVCRMLAPQTRLLIVGDSGAHAGALRSFVELLRLGDYVLTPGEVPLEDLPALYSAALFAVYPSLYEGFGLPPVEAMACGTPVICSDAGSLPEVVGRGALVVPAGDVTALAGAIHRMAGDPRLRMRLCRRGAEQAARYSWRAAAAEILRIYTELAAQEEEALR